MDKIGVAILGGTGYGAGELLRLLVEHPQVDVVSVVSQSKAGEEIAITHPHLSGFYEGKFAPEFSIEPLLKYPHALVFAALPHGASAQTIAQLHSAMELNDVRLIDLSGDFRLSNQEESILYYGDPGVAGAIRTKFCYGLPELYRDKIRAARFIANPGCLASACSLATLPLVDAAINGTVFFDAKAGTSGAGRSPQDSMHHPHRYGNVEAYKMLEHRHEPEIRQNLREVAGREISTAFVSHLIPVSRGIFVTAYGELKKSQSTEQLQLRYKEYYAASPFIRIRKQSPELGSVIGSNFCDISIFSRGNQFVAMSSLDNLVKGMVGVAIQNMNLMFGFPETLGLWRPAPGIL